MTNRFARCLYSLFSLVSCSGQSSTSSDDGGGGAAVNRPDAASADAVSPRAEGDLCGDRRCAPDSVCYTAECAGAAGVCTDLTSLCNALGAVGTVCGCDGRVYAKPCAAFEAGTMLAPAETCPSIDGRFRCGSEFCDPATQFCRHSVNGADMGFRRCFPLPSSCRAQTTPDCGCVADLGAISCLACRVTGESPPFLELDCNGVMTP